jgi:hypothetical protein
LDGISTNKRFKCNSDEKEASFKDYLQIKSIKSDNKKKKVRWKDFEEDKKLNKIKELGFIVGQTAEGILKHFNKSQLTLKEKDSQFRPFIM